MLLKSIKEKLEEIGVIRPNILIFSLIALIAGIILFLIGYPSGVLPWIQRPKSTNSIFIMSMFLAFLVLSASIASLVVFILINLGKLIHFLIAGLHRKDKSADKTKKGGKEDLIDVLEEEYYMQTLNYIIGVLFLIYYLSRGSYSQPILVEPSDQVVFYTAILLPGMIHIRFNLSLFKQLLLSSSWIVVWTVVYLICILLFQDQTRRYYETYHDELIILCQSSFLSLIITFIYVLFTFQLIKSFQWNIFVDIYCNITQLACLFVFSATALSLIFSHADYPFLSSMHKVLSNIGIYILTYYKMIVFALFIVGGLFIFFLYRICSDPINLNTELDPEGKSKS